MREEIEELEFEKEKKMKRLSFITQFKIEFLLLFTSYRKLLGKLLDVMLISVTFNSALASNYIKIA